MGGWLGGRVRQYSVMTMLCRLPDSLEAGAMKPDE